MPRSFSRTVLGGETEARARGAAVVGLRRTFRRLGGLNRTLANSNPEFRATPNWQQSARARRGKSNSAKDTRKVPHLPLGRRQRRTGESGNAWARWPPLPDEDGDVTLSRPIPERGESRSLNIRWLGTNLLRQHENVVHRVQRLADILWIVLAHIASTFAYHQIWRRENSNATLAAVVRFHRLRRGAVQRYLPPVARRAVPRSRAADGHSGLASTTVAALGTFAFAIRPPRVLLVGS